MPTSRKIIRIQPEAAPKPALGEPCNGCGVCCLVEPCPLGVVLSGRRSGACAALRWEGDAKNYCCGAITEPVSVLRRALPRIVQGLIPLLAPLLARLSKRWIAAGQGCDSALEVGVQSSASTSEKT